METLPKYMKWPLLLLMSTTCLSVVFYVVQSSVSSHNAVDNALWRDSVEKRIEEKSEKYYDEVYSRFSTMHRDLNNYQYNTTQSLRSLDNRIENLEKNNSVNITNTNNAGVINND